MIRLLMGGSPCTHWSIARTKGREKEPSGIGWELFENYKIARDKFRPDYFLYENNKSMSQAIRDQISNELGVEPVLINSALVSAQNRQRLYWVGRKKSGGEYEQVKIDQPADRGILLRDILEPITGENGYELSLPGKSLTEKELRCMLQQTKKGCNRFGYYTHKDAQKPKSPCLVANMARGIPYNVLVQPLRIGTIVSNTQNPSFDSQQYRVYSPDGKSVTLCGQGGGVGAKTGLYATLYAQENRGDYPIYKVENGEIQVGGRYYPIYLSDGYYVIRKLTVMECKRLQTVPDEYVFPVSATQAYKMLGNGWTVDVIVHILKHMPEISEEKLVVLSMYDGMSCGHIALKKMGINPAQYFATEIDKFAIKTTQTNFPDTIQLGDAFLIRESGWKLAA